MWEDQGLGDESDSVAAIQLIHGSDQTLTFALLTSVSSEILEEKFMNMMGGDWDRSYPNLLYTQ